MNPIKYASIVSAFAFACLAGCSSDDSESSPTNSGDGPKQTSIDVVSGCEEIKDATDKATIEKAKSDIVEVFSTFGKGDLTAAQQMSAATKETFHTILKKYPGNCEAQLGFVASIISDIANNQKINSILDTIYKRKGLPKASILSGNIEDAASVSINFSINSSEEIRGIPVKEIQSAIASVIPSLDSAVTYMTNIANDDNFTCTYKINNRDVELDRGEFAPALAALFAAKAALTAIVSINLEIDDNGDYSWLDSASHLYSIDFTKNPAVKRATTLMAKDSKFTAIYDSWKTEYRNIPNLLDSAITYVQLGLQYGLEEAKTGLETQENDLYVVGNDEFADLSTSDAQKIIDSLSTLRGKLKTGFDIPYANGKTLKVNVSKWFENTDGILKFLPYHVIHDAADWWTPDGGFYWSEDLEYQAYAQRYMQMHALKFFRGYYPERKEIYAYGWDETETTGGVFIELDDPYIELDLEYKAEGCKISFTLVDTYQDSWKYDTDEEEDPLSIDVPSVTLPEGICKTENGTTKYAVAYHENEVPNVLYFTDAKGNKTISLQELVNGKINDGDREDYSLSEMSKLIIFPDITFGGIFPDMTVEKFWNEFIPGISEEDEDDWDEDWDDDWYDME